MDNKTINHENDELNDQVQTGHSSEKTEIDSEELRKRVLAEKERRRNQEQSSRTGNNGKKSPQWKNKKKLRYIKPEKTNRVSLGIVFATMILAVSVVCAMCVIFLVREMIGINKSSSSYIIEIPQGATVSDIIDIMTIDQEKKGREEIIKVPALFKLLTKVKKADGKFIDGTHILRPDMGYLAIINELESEENQQRETVLVTISEGWNLNEAAKELEKNNVCVADKFLYYFNNGLDDYEFEKQIPKLTALDLRYYRMEGYLFPDTYEFYVADDIESLPQEEYEIIIRKFYDNFEEKFGAEQIAKAKEKGMTMNQVITLASIVQKEAADISDMYYVASVFENRLTHSDEFPRLESDTTEQYATDVIAKGDTLNDSMMEAYDTYVSGGLPPGPICNPGLEAIDAVLNPKETNYYYFCANTSTKEVYYAETLEEHEANIVKSDEGQEQSD
ncbi:MAG: endolytic transglycosylase MltG [Oscillospiraceae bacterium]|nr:endolytic transglycosylase MltG [Oscillospiraceae bacterium]